MRRTGLVEAFSVTSVLRIHRLRGSLGSFPYDEFGATSAAVESGSDGDCDFICSPRSCLSTEVGHSDLEQSSMALFLERDRGIILGQGLAQQLLCVHAGYVSLHDRPCEVNMGLSSLHRLENRRRAEQ